MSAPGTEGIVRAVEAAVHRFADDGAIPNNPILPFLVYPGALDLPGADPAAACENVFAANGWGGSWRDGIYFFPHYHSTAHEVLGICRGEAKVRFGGNAGIALMVRRGDVVASRCAAKFLSDEGRRWPNPVGERCGEHHQPVAPINRSAISAWSAERQNDPARNAGPEPVEQIRTEGLLNSGNPVAWVLVDGVSLRRA